MSEAGWRRLALGLAVVLVILLAAGGALLLFGGGGSTGSGSPTPSRSAATSASATASPSASPSASASPSVSPTSRPSVGPTSTALTTYPTTSITLVSLKLDAQADPAGQLRTIAFTSNGPSDILATIKITTPQSTARVCLKPGSGSPFCQTGSSTIKFSGKATGTTGSWTLTAIGDAISTPVVDITLTWRTKAPKVTLSNFRFDGTVPDAAYNGFTVTLKARAAGPLGLNFNWGGKPFPYDLLVQDNTDPSKTQEPTGTGTGVVLSVPASKDHAYRITLQNTSSLGAGRVALSGFLEWP
ncbi:MAG: hypothetical protein ACXWOW_07745 [Candidatus Limnocylindrales bacterium]